jgi:catalase
MSLPDDDKTAAWLLSALIALAAAAASLPCPTRVDLPSADELELEPVMLPRDAFFAAKETVSAASAIGRIAAKLDEVKSAAEQAQVNVELIAPAVGGVDDSDGNHAPADQKIDGGPAVLYDAVILLASTHGAPALAAQPAVRDFVADAYAHGKFIGYTGDASSLFEAAGLGGLTDDASSAWTSTPPPTSSRAAPGCGSGPARPASRSGPARRRRPRAKTDRRNHGTSRHRP